jgi:hypothetical protein
MYLVLGSLHDPCCVSVRDALDANDLPVRVVANPLSAPARFSWQLDDHGLAHRWSLDGLADQPIDGVLVRGGGWLEPDGWQPDDHAYMQAEMFAALVAWLRSLRCPVVNRYTADLWYRPHVPMLAWSHALQAAGLPTAETLLSNVVGETRDFGSSLATDTPGIVYTPLTSETQYLVSTDADWAGLAALQTRAPVCLTRPHGAPQLVTVIDGHVVWNGRPMPGAAGLEPALRRFAAAVELSFVELAVAPAAEDAVVVRVDHHPRIERYHADARQAIVERLVHLLTAGAVSTANAVPCLVQP